MIARPFEDVSPSDIETLIASRVAEHRTLEYKRQLPADTKDGSHELLADISSFANAQGGDIIYGIEERLGLPVAIHGITVEDRDATQLKLENQLYAGIEPRLPGLRTRWIDCGDEGFVFLVRVPSSTIAPHRVISGKSNAFYGRKSNGRYPMDTAELRQAFLASEALPVRMKALHMEAVDAASRGEMPIGIGDDPRAVLSLIPLTFFQQPQDLDITPENALMPLRPDGHAEPILMIEGILIHNIPHRTPATRAYALTHRSGRIDMAWTIGREHDPVRRPIKLISPEIFESGVRDAAISGAARLQPLGVEGPWQVHVTLSGIKDYPLGLAGVPRSDPAWRDEVSLPAIQIERMNRAALLPLLRTFWLAFGLNRPEDPDDQRE